MARQPSSLAIPQDELKRAFMRGIARTVRALDDVVVVARDTVGQATAKPKRRAKPKTKAKARAKTASKPRRAAAKSRRSTRAKSAAARKRPRRMRGS
jgi:hypothetical protein